MSLLKIVLLAVLTSFSVLAFSSEATYPNARELYLRAIATTEKTTFKACLAIYSNGCLQKNMIVNHVALPDMTVAERIDNVWPDGQKESCISNLDGSFMLSHGTIIKSSQKVSAVQMVCGADDLCRRHDLCYSVVDSTWKGVPCYELSITVPKDPSFVEGIINDGGNATAGRDYVMNSAPFSKTYLIDKSTLFIYSSQSVNLNGIVLRTLDWGDLDFNVSPGSELFTIPQGGLIGDDKSVPRLLERFSIPDTTKNLLESFKTPSKPNNSERAQSLLSRAAEAMAQMNFKATMEVSKGSELKSKIISYHKVTGNGKVLERNEYSFADGLRETFVIGNGRFYALIGSSYVKMDFPLGSRTFIYRSVSFDSDEVPEYSIADSSYNGIPCYKITKKISSDAVNVEQRIARLQRNSTETKDELLSRLEFARTYLVGKENLFIYACSFYNAQGRRTRAEEWGTVEFDVEIPNALFDYPPGTPTFVAKNRNEFNRIFAKCNSMPRK